MFKGWWFVCESIEICSGDGQEDEGWNEWIVYKICGKSYGIRGRPKYKSEGLFMVFDNSRSRFDEVDLG